MDNSTIVRTVTVELTVDELDTLRIIVETDRARRRIAVAEPSERADALAAKLNAAAARL